MTNKANTVDLLRASCFSSGPCECVYCRAATLIEQQQDGLAEQSRELAELRSRLISYRNLALSWQNNYINDQTCAVRLLELVSNETAVEGQEPKGRWRDVNLGDIDDNPMDFGEAYEP